MEEYIVCQEDCEYEKKVNYEYDTGYYESECDLLGDYCCGEDQCPLNFKYSVQTKED